MSSPSPSVDPPPALPYSGEWEYDVFLCFRGDTRNNFMSHLEQAMRAKKIRVFVDTMLQVTQDIGELLQILTRTAVSVVIFSGKFADSSWCLDEVYTIAQSVENLGHRAIPVFYNVDWTTVVGDYHWFDDFKAVFLSCFRSCFFPQATLYAKTIAGLDDTQARKDEWIGSLKAVALRTESTSATFPVEAELVEEVVAKVLTALASMSSGIEFNKLVGIDSRVSDVEQLLAMDEHDIIRIVGFWGMGGLGKSTLARTCYERLKRLNKEEMSFHFIDKINESCDGGKRHLVEGLVQQLYSAMLSENHLTRRDVNVGYRRARLSRMKVFVVLDDVQAPSQLEQLLLGEALSLMKLFASGSRIILTTRNQTVLEYAKSKMYTVEHLNDADSLQLFKMHAFEPVPETDDWNFLSHKVISYCKGNPLALKVIGGTLLYKEKPYWENFLQKLSEIQEPEIHHVLKRSYGELEMDDRRLFLDIACFFYGTVKSLLVKYMETIYTSAYSRVEDLVDKSLVISTTDKFQGEIVIVHGLLREMAWNVINEEENVGQRSRMKDPHDIHNLLTNREGDRATQSIHLDLSKAEDMYLKANAFKGMDSLRWLDFGWPKCVGYGNPKIKLSDGDLNSLPNELRGLYWDNFPSTSLPSGFSPQKLAYLVISHSPLHKCWERDQPKLEYLMLLGLSNCEKLITVPNLTSCSNLEHILLRGCKTLIAIPATIHSLVRLVRLDARDCQNLKNVPSRLDSKFLKQLLLSNCPNLTQCPEVVHSTEFHALDLDGSPISSLPNSIYKVKQNGMLSLYGPNVTRFPRVSARLELIRLRQTTIANIEFDDNNADFSKLDRLHLIQNAQLKTLPTNIWNMVSVELIVQDCPLIECLPVISEPYSHSLTKLRIAGCASVTEFPTCICKLRLLEVLVFVGTGIKSLPCCIGELEQLSYLDLSYNAVLESVPSTIQELAKLSELLLIGCGSIESLPEMLPPNLNVLKANNCGSLQALSRNVGNLSFQHLRLDDCPKLDSSFLDEIVVNFPDQALSRHSHVCIFSPFQVIDMKVAIIKS
ncbi:Disease resistance-like protein DSC1 [Linum grandiflorum]